MSGSKAQIIALAGKGGVGKTSLGAAMVRLIVENHPGKRILAIDADPAVGLATAFIYKLHQVLKKHYDALKKDRRL